MNNNILLTGPPRSGTTWLSQVLTVSGNYHLVHEPDNEKNSFAGLYYKKNLNRFPFLSEKDVSEDFYMLFEKALTNKIFTNHSLINQAFLFLSGYNRDKIEKNLKTTDAFKVSPVLMWFYEKIAQSKKEHQNVLIKSVHSLLSLPYLIQNFNITPLILIRHPLNIFSSHLRLQMEDMDRQIYANKNLLEYIGVHHLPGFHNMSPNQKAGLQLGMFYSTLEYYTNLFNNIILVKHEDLLELNNIKNLFKRLYIPYDDKTDTFIKSKMNNGAGYQIQRDPSTLHTVWKSRLSNNEKKEFIAGYKTFQNNLYPL